MTERSKEEKNKKIEEIVKDLEKELRNGISAECGELGMYSKDDSQSSRKEIIETIGETFYRLSLKEVIGLMNKYEDDLDLVHEALDLYGKKYFLI